MCIRDSSRTTPSIVGFTKDKEIVIGDQARRQLVLNPKNTFYNLKRFIGSDWDELDENSISVPYNVKANNTGSVRVLSPNTEREYAPEELVSSLIRKLINFLISELTNSSGAYSLSVFGLRTLTLPVLLAFTL